MTTHDWGDDIAAYNTWFAETGGWESRPSVGEGYRGNRADMSLGYENRLRHEVGPDTVIPGWDGWRYGGLDPGLFPLADRR